jgi:excisionase family DNA binding protein
VVGYSFTLRPTELPDDPNKASGDTVTTPGGGVGILERSAFLDVESTAEYLSITTRHVYRLVSERRIAFHKFGNLLRFKVRDLDEFAEARRTEAAA